MKDHTMHRYTLALATLPLLYALAGCGGGADGDKTVVPTSCAGDCIEPYDPGVLAKHTLAAQPASTPLLAHDATVPTVTLAPLTPQPATAGTADPGQPLQIGQGRASAQTATPDATAALLHWQASARETHVAALRFASQDAFGVRLGVSVEALPADALLRVYGEDGVAYEITSRQLQDLAQRNAAGGASEQIARIWWSPQTQGAQATLEIEIPATADAADVRIAVPRLTHITASRQPPALILKKTSGACEINVVCTPEFIDQGRSVARLYFVDSADGNAYLCTGTLLNDAQSSGKPYLLTARHCIADQATASTLVTDWLWRASACGSADTDAAHQERTGGATLLHADKDTDVAFMLLNAAVPAGVVYAGSYFGPDAGIGTQVSVVHHPQGDLQKVSQGTVRGYNTCTLGAGDSILCSASDEASGTFLSVNWQQGITEPGSSGTGAFVAIGARRYLAGQLFAGTPTSCEAPNGTDYFGRFNLSYRNALRTWLDP